MIFQRFSGAGAMRPAFLLLALCAGAHAQGWTLTWQDEFTGPVNARPDSSKWNIEIVESPYNNELQYYTDRPENVRLNGAGQLELTARREEYQGKQYTSGRINSSAKFEKTYGRWEARMQLPWGAGLWPAFWLLGSDNGCGGWPDCGEVDIMEFRGRLPRASGSALHGPGYSGNTPVLHTNTLPSGGPDFTQDFHIFALEWEPTQMRFYVDSTLHYTVPRTFLENNHGAWVFNHNFHTLLNLAVGGVFDNGIVPADSVFPAKVTVDYVRVYDNSLTSIGAVDPALTRRGARRLEADLVKGRVLFVRPDGGRMDLLGRPEGVATPRVRP